MVCWCIKNVYHYITVSFSQTYDDYLIYSFMLSYNPQATGTTVVVRAITISMLLECHYPRCVS